MKEKNLDPSNYLKTGNRDTKFSNLFNLLYFEMIVFITNDDIFCLDLMIKDDSILNNSRNVFLWLECQEREISGF